jgi:hypothetical protein
VSRAAPLQSLLPARGHHLPAAVAVALAVGGLVGLGAVLDGLGRLAAVLVLQLGLVLAWVLATGLQGFAGALAVGAAAAVAVDLAVVLPARPALGSLLPVFGLGFLAVVLQQMVRRPRPELVASLAGSALLVAAVGALGALLLVGGASTGGAGADGRHAVTLAAVAVAVVVGHLVDLVLPHPRLATGVPRGFAGLVLAVAAATAVAWLLRGAADLGAARAVLLGAAVGGVAALAAVAASFLVVEVTAGGRGPGHLPDVGPRVPLWSLPVVQAVLPVAAAAPVALGLESVL